MRVHIVEPQKERAGVSLVRQRLFAEPGDRLGSLHLSLARQPCLVVDVESLTETKRSVEIRVVDGCGRAIAGGLKRLRERLIEVGQITVSHVESVLRGIEPREHRGETTSRLRPVSESRVEGDALRGKGVDMWARRPRVSVDAEVIVAERVDRNEKDVDPGVRCCEFTSLRRTRAGEAEAGDEAGGSERSHVDSVDDTHEVIGV